MTLSFNVDDILKGTNDITLQREDQVIIQNIFSMREKRIGSDYGGSTETLANLTFHG